MPIFTLPKVGYPYQDITEQCFGVNIVVPDPDLVFTTPSGYVCWDVGRSMISRQLAGLLNLDYDDERAVGHIMIETRYEYLLHYESAKTHRTSGIEIEFCIAPSKLGEGYFHIAQEDLEDVMDMRFRTSGSGMDFLTLEPIQGAATCLIRPRPSS